MQPSRPALLPALLAPAFVLAAIVPVAPAGAQVPSPAAGAGAVVAVGSAPALDVPALAGPSAVVAMAAAAAGGYWLAQADGAVAAAGGATVPGSAAGLDLRRPVVAMAATPTGAGYWLAGADGGVFAYGDAAFAGSAGGLALNQPVVGMASHPGGSGYWLVARDGGVFAFDGAPFLGSTGGLALNQPVVAMAATPTGAGYWLAAADGGVFAFGDAVAAGDATAALGPGRAVVAMAVPAARPGAGPGYWLATADAAVASGAVGPGVEGIQRRLSELGYWGPVDGRFGPLTTQQVYAFQKANGLARDGRLDAGEVALLARAGRVQPRSTAGHVIEVDKGRQLLIVARDGRAEWVFNTSTGNGARYAPGKVAVTPEGRFTVQRQINGLRISALGALFRPKYFTGGYAVHGSPSIPPFPASHGCVRVSNAAIDFIWANRVMELGAAVWVYS